MFEDRNSELSFLCDIYMHRIEISAETFLIEANARGGEMNKGIYAKAVGLGLGVWMKFPDIQRQIYLQAFQNVLQRNSFEHIKVLELR